MLLPRTRPPSAWRGGRGRRPRPGRPRGVDLVACLGHLHTAGVHTVLAEGAPACSANSWPPTWSTSSASPSRPPSWPAGPPVSSTGPTCPAGSAPAARGGCSNRTAACCCATSSPATRAEAGPASGRRAGLSGPWGGGLGRPISRSKSRGRRSPCRRWRSARRRPRRAARRRASTARPICSVVTSPRPGASSSTTSASDLELLLADQAALADGSPPLRMQPRSNAIRVTRALGTTSGAPPVRRW